MFIDIKRGAYKNYHPYKMVNKKKKKKIDWHLFN